MQSYELLEQEFAAFCKMPHVVACNSGTAALHLALEVLKMPQHGGVILPNYTMVACARAVTLADLKPIFVDCYDTDLTMSVEAVEKQLTPSYKYENQPWAIMAVHTYGARCQMDDLAELADKHKLYLIEDLAEAHGIDPHERTDAACWSFYQNKIVAGEEGGAVAFRQAGWASRAKELRSVGFTKAHDYTHVPRGHNYRLANCLADKIRESLANYDARVEYRWKSWNRLDTELSCIKTGPIKPQAPWVFAFEVPTEMRSQLVYDLQREGVPARYGFKPMSEQEEYKSKIRTPVSLEKGRIVLYLNLPLTEKQIETAVRIVKSYVNEKSLPPSR